MKSKIKVAITGGIGSGKTTVSKYIAGLGYPVFSCDEIYKNIYATDNFQNQLKAAFPTCLENGRLDKSQLTQLVFSNASALRQLNALSHPLIMTELFLQMQAAKSKIVFAEVPLLMEENLDEAFDFVIVVVRDRERRIEAICNRDQINRAAAEARIKNQWDYDLPENKTKLLQDKFFVIENNTIEQHLQSKIEKVISRLIDDMKQ